MSDNIGVLAAAAAVLIIIKRRRRRREERSLRTIWCRQYVPWLADRPTDRGMRHFIVNQLMPADAIGFHRFLRMSSEIFNELLEMISPRLQNVDTFMKNSIGPHEMLVATLRFLAYGKVLFIESISVISDSNECAICLYVISSRSILIA